MLRKLKIAVTAALGLVAAWVAAEEEDKYAEVRAQIQSCVACHGEAGANPILPEYPILAGQHMYYLYLQLKDIKAKRRDNAIMYPIANALEKDQMKLIATYFSEQEWPGNELTLTNAEINAAREVITAGQCVQCHRGNFHGDSGIPRTAGQKEAYLAKTLLDFKHGRRLNNAAKSSLMKTFSDEQLQAVAKYFAALPEGEDTE